MSNALSINPVSHCFDIEDAKLYGVTAAVIFKNFKYWIWHNKLNESKKHWHNGRYWTYNSISDLQKTVFPYLSIQNIRTAIDKLTECKALITGQFNKKNYDRTTWYSVPHKSAEGPEPKDDYQKQQMHLLPVTNEWQSAFTPNHLLELTNRQVETNQPIPDITTNIKEKRKKRPVPAEPTLSAKDLLEYWNSKSIIQHTITDTLIADIAKAISKKGIPLEAIKQAIDRFADVLHRKDCFWNKKWTLREFLSERAIRFYLEDFSIESYLSSSSPKEGLDSGAKFTQSACLTDQAEEIFKAARLRGLLEDQKNGVTYEHLP